MARSAGGAHHLIAVLAAKGPVKFGYVHQRADDAELVGGVWVGLHALAQRFGALMAVPRLGIAQEEALLGRESVDFLLRFGLRDTLKGRVGNGQAAEVGQVLPHRQLAVDVRRIEGREGIKLLAHHGGAGRKPFAVFLGPPVAQVALGVVLPALVIEPVGHFVANDGADAAVVGEHQKVWGNRRHQVDNPCRWKPCR